MATPTAGTEAAAVIVWRVWRIADGLLCRRWLAFGGRPERRVKGKQLAGTFSQAGGGWAEKPVAADLLKAFGEDVLEKTCDEGLDGKGEVSRLLSAGTDIAESDATVVEGFDAVVGEGDAMSIAGEVLGSVLAVASVLEEAPRGAQPRRKISASSCQSPRRPRP
ncbi:MAG: hypothetical protein WAM82_24475 [Thermoanaerobaculia bacterium]